MPNLRIGDWRHQSVAELLDEQQGDGFYKVIVDGGFKLLYQIIQQREPEIYRRLPELQSALSPCHLCEMLMVGPDARQIRQICDDYITDRLITEITANADLIGQLLP
jgi:hypothetical protein